MRKMKLREIVQRTDTPEFRAREEKIRNYVRSQPDYKPGRKRPKDPEEEKILSRLRGCDV